MGAQHRGPKSQVRSIVTVAPAVALSAATSYAVLSGKPPPVSLEWLPVWVLLGASAVWLALVIAAESRRR